MPTVVRQKPPAPNGQPIKAKPGSVLAKAIPVSEIKDSWIKMMIYGGNGIGKTTLACEFEKPLLLLSYERCPSAGARSVRRKPGITWLRMGLPDGKDPNDGEVVIRAPDVLEDTRRVIGELIEKNPFKTIVFDHVTVFQDWVLEDILGERMPAQLGKGKVSTDEYVRRAENTKELLRPFLDLPCHTVFIGKEKDHNPPKDEKVNPNTGKVAPDLRPKFIRGMQQESFVSVELGGGTAGWLQDACEYACRLYMDRKVERVESIFQGNKVVDYVVVEPPVFVRALRIAYHPNFFSRFRSDMPENMPEAIAEPTYKKILAAINGSKVE